MRACVRAQLLSHVQLFETPWTVAHQAPLLMGFSRQEYWSGLSFPSPELSLAYLKDVQNTYISLLLGKII